MKNIVQGLLKFRENIFEEPENRELYRRLVEQGQKPEVMLLTCADSRIDPARLTQTAPGELFIYRNAGNVAPPPESPSGSGLLAAVEFALQQLRVRELVVCGHSHCGAVAGAVNPDGLSALPHVRAWASHIRPAVERVQKARGGQLSKADVDEVARQNVVQQLENLKQYPGVAARLAEGSLTLHGWMYRLETGEVSCHDEKSGEFLSVEKYYADLLDG